MVVASGLRFATQILNVSVPQAIGWSQIEVSLAVILACAPMCVKVLFAPLVDPGEFERMPRNSQFLETPTFRLASEESGYVQYWEKERSLVARSPSTQRQVSFSAPKMRLDDAMLSAEQLPPSYYREYSDLSAESSVDFSDRPQTPGDISIPDHQRLRVARAEVNDQSSWEVSTDHSKVLAS